MSEQRPLSYVNNNDGEPVTDGKQTQSYVPPLVLPADDSTIITRKYLGQDITKYFAPAIVPSYQVPEAELAANIDEPDMGNPFTVAIYAETVYGHLSYLEQRLRPTPNYMLRQPQINAQHRAQAINRLIDLHRALSQKYQTSLQADTLFISFSLLDRFLSRKQIAEDKLDLAALGCFFIAAKFEETYYPSIEQLLAFCTHRQYTKEELIKIERIILTELRYSLGCPTPLTFLKRFAKAANADSNIGMVARFLAEHSMISYRLATNYLPSQIAAAAISHALRITGRPPWTATLQHYSGYSYNDLLPLMREMKEWLMRVPVMVTQAAFSKYSQQKYLRASYLALARL